MKLSRRQFVQLAAAGGAAAALVGVRRRSARAQEPPRARRLLILNASGGLRTTAAFNASPRKALNPWGVAGTAGALRLGRVLTMSPAEVTDEAPSWTGAPTVPAIGEIASQLALIAAVDHAPGQPRAGDHPDDSLRMGTGYFGKDGSPGFVTFLARHLGEDAIAPIVAIGGGELALAPGEWSRWAPTRLSPSELPSQPPRRGHPLVGQPIEQAIDDELRAARSSNGLALVDGYLGTKQSVHRYGPILAEPALHVGRSDLYGELLGGVTNRMVLEAVGNQITAGSAGHADGLRVALALRLLQRGSPVVVVSVGGFDLHSEEATKAPALYTRFARYLAGIHFFLSHVDDGSGAPLLDSTLVVTTSEFGRSAGSATTGFNDADGSDHGDHPGWRNQAHVLFGAGVRPNLLAPTDDDNVPTDGAHTTQALFTTIATALGVPGDAVDEVWPAGSPLFPEGRAIQELWE